VTELELNRALLARQLLLARHDLPIPRALERLGGIQNQYAPNGYIRLASCLERFRRDDLTRALERRTVVQATLTRSTIHLVSAREYWLFAEGLRGARQQWWLRVQKGDRRKIESGAARLREALADGPLTRRELDARLGTRLGGAALWVDLVRVPPQGTWEQRRADRYALAEQWLGPSTATEEQGLEHLVRSYLRGFGPATLKDVSSWAGVPLSLLRPAAERLPLRQLEGGLLDLPRAPLAGGVPAPVRFLPTWDAILLAHARRSGVLPEEYRPLLFHTKNPQSAPSFLVDGRVAGLWRHERGRIVLEPFGRLSRRARSELADESERIRSLHEP
jgi:hypothetical protein